MRVTKARTFARIGRSMKYWEIMALPPFDAAVDRALRGRCPRILPLRGHRSSRNRFLNALDDDPFLPREPLFDDTEILHRSPRFDTSVFDKVLLGDNQHIGAALVVSEGLLGD